jgi:hypothetical protein
LRVNKIGGIDMGTHVYRKDTKICVIESRWWDKKNTSVRGVFDLISDIHTGNHHGYKYEMANSKAAFYEIIPRICKDNDTNYISIAMHGCKQYLEFANGDRINRKEFRDLFARENNKSRNTCGVHFGSCSFFDSLFAKFIFEKDTSAWWLAGYSKSIDWIESSALDQIFFSKLMKNNGSMRKKQINAIKDVAIEMKEQVNGLVKELGFQIWICDIDKKPDRIL